MFYSSAFALSLVCSQLDIIIGVRLLTTATPPHRSCDPIPAFEPDKVVNGARASIICQGTCRYNKQTQKQCKTGYVRGCHAAIGEKLRCECKAPVCPAPSVNPITREHIGRTSTAILLVGDTRTFTSSLVQAGYLALLQRMQTAGFDPVIIAVVDIVSMPGWRHNTLLCSNKTDRQCLRYVEANPTVFQPAEIESALASFGVPVRSVLLESSRPEVLAKSCKDDAIRHLVGQRGISGQWAKRAVAFDLMLHYEQEFGSPFEHVLMCRPDKVHVVHDLDSTIPATAVMMDNDQFASMPRSLSPYYFLSGIATQTWFPTRDAMRATLKGMRFALNSEHISCAPGDLYCAYPSIPHFEQPTFYLSFHGVPFCGDGLEMLPQSLACGAQPINVRGFIVRNAKAGAHDRSICLENYTYQALLNDLRLQNDAVPAPVSQMRQTSMIEHLQNVPLCDARSQT